MKGKLVNSIVGAMNLLFGALVLLFKIYLPRPEIATQGQTQVINEYKIYLLGLTILVAIVNFIIMIFNRKDKILLFSYLLAILSSASYFIDVNYIGVLYILAALLIEIQVLRENMIYTNNMTYIVITSVVILAIGILGINVLTYKDKVTEIEKEENKGYIEYQKDYFKNISMLQEDAEFYINIQIDGKWGYINTSGETKIDFKYDYASPFVTINSFDKTFDVALVCQGDTASIILKNQREVLTYKNEIDVSDYEKQLEKFEDIYQNTFKQENIIENKLESVETSNKNSIKSYENYPYRYKFNDQYDVYITVSQTGGKNRYEFIKQDSPTTKISLDCDDMEFDSGNLYVYSNGYMPFYKSSENTQGWYSLDTRRVEFEGNIQILEFFGENILIKDYDQGIIYFADEKGNQVSPTYKDIYVLSDGYIVKNENNKYIIINKQFEQILSSIEYDYINPNLLNQGILICANLPAKVNFNNSGFPSNIEYELVSTNGEKITIKDINGTEIENPTIQNTYYIKNKKTVASYDIYINNLTDILYEFVGEKFYKN